ncbi:MAG: hypothetical protein KF893_24025 [Caldilineaceae bacterium]|nr:hypothetical protein [Caldilineaceae bacterium]
MISPLRVNHRYFLLILLLFVSFRMLAVLLFRPGGFIADFSDYDFYLEWGRLTARGYRAYDNLWTAYPPLFPLLMQAVFDLSARIPPWIDPRFFFHTLLGMALLLFETGNLILIYRLSIKLLPAEDASLPPILYALLFAPVYTLLGWFESMPLFFMLLGLDLLLTTRLGRWGWMASALAAALGFLTKLTPALLIPIAVRWLGSTLSPRAFRTEWFNPRSPGNLLRPLLYTLIFVGTVIGVGYPLVRANPALALSSFRVQDIRPPWQSLWAVLDGYFGYGLVPLDMRNLAGLAGPLWESRLPWTWITLGFLLLYLWLYTRPYDWTRPRTPVAFAAVSVIWLFLYSKGWSPQFVVWVLTFTVLLLPTLRGIAIAIVLTVVNFVEANVFLIMLPDQHWLLWGTVLTRTILLILLAVEFLGQIWPTAHGITLRRAGAILSWATLALVLIASIAATPRASHAYVEQRMAAHPCREGIRYLQEEADWPAAQIVTEEFGVWESLYPWLRGDYSLHVLDGYSPDRDPAEIGSERLATLVAGAAEFWWIARDQPLQSGIGRLFFADPQVQVVETERLGECTLNRVVQIPTPPLAVAGVMGGPIALLRSDVGVAKAGNLLHLVLYWQAQAAVDERYTVFTQLLDPTGQLIAQQDNWPVRGLAPTDSWQPGVVVRDPYTLAIPAETEAGRYRLLIGLYTDTGRRPFTLANGEIQDYVEMMIDIGD